jgi:hypothetical protein
MPTSIPSVSQPIRSWVIPPPNQSIPPSPAPRSQVLAAIRYLRNSAVSDNRLTIEKLADVQKIALNAPRENLSATSIREGKRLLLECEDIRQDQGSFSGKKYSSLRLLNKALTRHGAAARQDMYWDYSYANRLRHFFNAGVRVRPTGSGLAPSTRVLLVR